MLDERYSFAKVIAVKAIIESRENKVLLIKEPEDHVWMPGRWGFPGGKPFEKESIYDAFKRKMSEEVGLIAEPDGIYKIEELLLEEKSVYMFHAAVKNIEPDQITKIESELRWVGIDEVQEMKLSQFTEFFNKKLLLDYLSGDRELVDFGIVETQNYYDLHDSNAYQSWLADEKQK